MRGPRLFDHTDWKSKKGSGESRKLFLPVLGQKPRTVVKVEKIFVVADKKRQMSLR